MLFNFKKPFLRQGVFKIKQHSLRLLFDSDLRWNNVGGSPPTPPGGFKGIPLKKKGGTTEEGSEEVDDRRSATSDPTPSSSQPHLPLIE